MMEEEYWVIWNGSLGILDTVTIGHIEVTANGRDAWLEEPYDMVGPFSFDELETRGLISFAACVVMSRQRWRQDQVELRQESHRIRREAQERLFAEQARRSRQQQHHYSLVQQFDETQFRQSLNLPVAGELKAIQIKAAYRRLAQKAHPDAGGSQEQFVLITQARDALLARIS